MLLVGWHELHMLMRNNYSEQVRQRRVGQQNSRANDNAISAWAIIGNFTFELIFHIKWMITRLTVPWLCRVLYYTCTDFKTSALLNACDRNKKKNKCADRELGLPELDRLHHHACVKYLYWLSSALGGATYVYASWDSLPLVLAVRTTNSRAVTVVVTDAKNQLIPCSLVG